MCRLTFISCFLMVSLLSLTGCLLEPAESMPTLRVVATVPSPTELAAAQSLPTIPPTNTPIQLTPPAAAVIPATMTPKRTHTPAGCRQSGKVEAGSFSGTIAGADFAYQIYLPPCYGVDGRVYPTLYMFGGNIHDETIWTSMGLHTLADEGVQTGLYPPFIIVMPDGGQPANFTSGGPGSYEGLVLNELIPFIESTYCAWEEPAGRAIGGLSRGGYWSLEIAFRNADHFASVGGHSPAFLDTAAGPDLNPEFTVFSYDVSNLRLYVDIGAEDYLRLQIEAWHHKLVAADIEHEWVLNPGGHNEAYWAGNSPAYLSWYTEPWPFNRANYPACQPD